jgi:thermitase
MKRARAKILVSFLTALLVLSTIPFPVGATPIDVSSPPNVDSLPGEILVKFKPGVRSSEKEAMNNAVGSTVVDEISQIRVQRVRKASGLSLQAAIENYRKNPLVEYAEPNYSFSLFTVPNDSSYALQWAPPKIQAEEAWDLETGGSSAVIAVVDSGVDYNHPDLAGKVIQGYDYHNNDADPMDDNGHGTHVAGIAAAVTNNSLGMAGLSWGSPILAIKAVGSDGVGYTFNIAYGITYAADNGAKVINLSLGGPTSSSTMKSAIDYALARDITVVASIGNDGNSTVNYPAAYPGVIGVGATGQTDVRSHFSDYNAYVDVVAPGENIYSTYRNSYASLSGTSMAAPHVAGLTALIMSEYPTATRDDVESRLQSAAVDLGSAGRDNEYGFGRIDAYNALTVTSLRYQETSGRLSYLGTWNPYSNASYSGGTTKYTNSAGASATLTFSGTSVTPLSCVTSNRGIAKVYIDGVYQQDIDLYSATTQYQKAVFTKAGLASGIHTLKVEVAGTKNPASSNYYVDVDAFDIATVPDTTPPTAPSSLTATALSSSQIDLSWTASTDNVAVSGYNIYRSTDNVTFSNVGASVTTSYSSSSLSPSTTYYYYVVAYDESGNTSVASNTASAITSAADSAPPTAPSALSATAVSSSQINLSWTASSDNVGVAGYRVERGTDGISFAEIATTPSTSYSSTGLSASTTYYFRVRAYDSEGNDSSYSDVTSATTLAVPTRYEQTSPSVAWTGTWNNYSNANYSGGSTKYSNGTGATATLTFNGTSVVLISCVTSNRGIAKVYIDGIYQQSVDLYSPSTQYQKAVYTKSGLAAGAHTVKIEVSGTKNAASSNYYVDVDAFDVAAIPDTLPPSAPSSLVATAASSSQINLSWVASTDDVAVIGYGVERSADGIDFAEIATTTGTSYSSTGLSASTTYYYRVRAYDAAGNNSGYSDVASATTPAAPTRYEQTSPSVAWTGTWNNYSNANYSGGSTKYSNGTGATATLTFNGTSVVLISCVTSNRGIAKVYIDGIYQQSVDLYSPSTQYQKAVYTKSGLAAGAHTVKIEVSGTKNAASSNYYVDVDAFDVI